MRFGKRSLFFELALLFFIITTAAPALAETTEKVATEHTPIIRPAERPCPSEETVHKITIEELSGKVKDFTEGDPLFFTLLSMFSNAKKDACYYVDGKDLQKIYVNKAILDLSDSEVRDGKTFYKTRAPVEEIRWVSAKISEGNIKVSSRLHSHFIKSVFGTKVLGIPKTLDLTIRTACEERTEGSEEKRNTEEYHISITYERAEEPYISSLVTLLTGFTSREMRVRRHDRKANRREAYKTLHYLHEKGLITIN